MTRSAFAIFGSLSKIEEQSDGTLKVYGIASSGARDDMGEIILPSAMRAALPAYSAYPAVREQHRSDIAAGSALEVSVDDDGLTHIVAHVVDSGTAAKVRHKVLRGFSVGGQVLKRDPKDPTVITHIKLSEISLVDRPANPDAAVTMWKAGGQAALDDEAEKLLTAAIARAKRRSASGEDRIDDLIKRLSTRGVPVTDELAKYVVGLEDQLSKAKADLAEYQERQTRWLKLADTAQRALEAEIEELKKSPMPPKTAASSHAFRSVSKEEDGGSPVHDPADQREAFTRYAAALPEDERNLLLMKVALRAPVRMTP